MPFFGFFSIPTSTKYKSPKHIAGNFDTMMSEIFSIFYQMNAWAQNLYSHKIHVPNFLFWYTQRSTAAYTSGIVKITTFR